MVRSASDTHQVMTLSELLGAMSHALDMTEGLPSGHSARTAFIAQRVADHIGIAGQPKRDLFYTGLLKDAGCSSNAARLCEIYRADDLKLKHDYRTVGPSLSDTLRYVLAQSAPGQGYALRARTILNIVRNGPALVQEMVETRCHRGADIVRRLHLAEEAAQAVASLDEHWDGGGRPLGLKGETIPLFSRVVLLAQVAEVFHASAGREAAIVEVRRRSGSWFDPAMVRAFERAASDPAMWAALDHGAEAMALAEADVDESSWSMTPISTTWPMPSRTWPMPSRRSPPAIAAVSRIMRTGSRHRSGLMASSAAGFAEPPCCTTSASSASAT